MNVQDIGITGHQPGEGNEEVHVSVAPAAPAGVPESGMPPAPPPVRDLAQPVSGLPENDLVGGPVLSEDWGRIQAPEPVGHAVGGEDAGSATDND
jgi:hypothetical protein